MPATKEIEIQRSIQLKASELGHRLFRNNVGLSETKTGYKIRYGLCKGSSDLIGWTKWGQFLAIEVKRPGGKPTKEQRAFLEQAKSAGCIAGVCCSVDEFVRLVRGLQ